MPASAPVTGGRDRAVRVLTAVTVAAGFLSALIHVTGGIEFRIARAVVRAHSPVIPATIASAACLIGVLVGRGRLAAASSWWWGALERHARWLALFVALATVAVGWIAGTHVAGGSDSHCYLSQAEMFARGEIRIEQPLAAVAPWPGADWTFVPAGYAPVPSRPGAIVPVCPAGYPLLMIPARVVAGRAGMLAVVPLSAGIAVFLAFALARRLAGPIAGVLASVLLASSPAFLYQAVQPMSDTVAAMLWLATLVVAWRAAEHLEAPLLSLAAGVVAGTAVLVRPNLVPLAAVAAAALVFSNEGTFRSRVRAIAAFGVGCAPFIVAFLLIQNAMYGGPFKSGYGDFSGLFSATHVVPNLQRYPRWLIATETPLVLLGLFAPFAVASRVRRASVWLLGFIVATLACYLPYSVFDAWWYLRFLLPAYGPLLALMCAVLAAGAGRIVPAWRALAVVFVTSALVLFYLAGSVRGYVFDLRAFERVYRDGADYVAARLPPNAAIVTRHQSGSVRFYSGRVSVVWDMMDPAWLDRAFDYLRARGYRPYVLLETNEEADFRARFEGHSTIGGLDWPPIASINGQVRIYDPATYAPYKAGQPIYTDRVLTTRR